MDFEIEYQRNGLAGSVLTGLEEIIYSVLKHLPMKELHRVARVNSAWNRVVKQIKRSRRQIAWCYYYEMESGGVDVQIGQAIESLASEPHLALVFSSSALHETSVSIPSKSSRLRTVRLPRAPKQEKIPFANYLERILPPSCQLSGACTDGVVATDFRSNQVVEMENSVSASCLFLPQIEGVDIYSFTLRDNLADNEVNVDEANPTVAYDEDDDDDDVGMMPDDAADGAAIRKDFFDHIPENKHPKLVLLFIADPNHERDKTLIFKIIERYDDVVVAGGITDNLILDKTLEEENSDEDEPLGLGIAFCGDNIRVASFVLLSSINDEKSVESELGRLKSANLPEENSVAFMFACIGRGENFYGGRTNVESKAFRKLFPKIPLLGFFGNGEIGFNHLPDCCEGMEKAPSGDEGHSTMTTLHSYTSIFVIVSFPR